MCGGERALDRAVEVSGERDLARRERVAPLLDGRSDLTGILGSPVSGAGLARPHTDESEPTRPYGVDHVDRELPRKRVWSKTGSTFHPLNPKTPSPLIRIAATPRGRDTERLTQAASLWALRNHKDVSSELGDRGALPIETHKAVPARKAKRAVGRMGRGRHQSGQTG